MSTWIDEGFIAFDTETTGVDTAEDRIVTAAAVLFRDGEPQETRSWLIKVDVEIPERASEVHGITNEIINGAVSAAGRGQIVSKFQTSPTPRVLVIQPQAASHGVTLTAADTIVFWSPVMSVETYLQCVARIDRVGQKNRMTVVHLQGSDVEKRMYKMLQGKVDSHEQLIDLYKSELGIG